VRPVQQKSGEDMNMVSIDRAKKRVKEFLDRVAEMEIKFEEDETAFYGCRESAALRRSSMDLTRALADLRRAG
jgi:hypothetical protein